MKVTAIVICVALVAALLAGAAWLWTPDKSRTELQARYLAAPGDLIDVAGMRMHVRDGGRKDAPAVVFLHGFGASLHTWEPWAQALSIDYRVIRMDLPGFGLTGADPAGTYTVARSVEVLSALMDRLSVRKANWC